MAQARVDPHVRTAPPNTFLDWINIALGCWLIASPWVIGATLQGAWNAWITGGVIAIISFVAVGSSRRAATAPPHDAHQVEWANVVAAVWLFISPWVLAMTYAMAWNAWIVGVIVFAVAMSGATWTPPGTYATHPRV